MEKTKKIIDMRMVYIMPSVLALAIAFTSLAYQFGNQLVDLKNTCYYLYFSPYDSEGKALDFDESMQTIDEILMRNNISGFTLNNNLHGGYKGANGTMRVIDSYELILMDISKKDAYHIADELVKEFNNQEVLIEEVVAKYSIIGGPN